jgi:hypothetical protein
MLTLSKYLKSSTRSCFFSFRVLCFWVLMTMAMPFSGIAQEDDNYDEVSVILNVQRIGSVELQIIIVDQTAYLPIKEVFDFLRIKNTVSADFESIEGFFINPKSVFLIDQRKTRIEYLDKIYNLKHNDFIKTETGLYLKLENFGDVFGLDCNFSFRSLSIIMTTKVELPAILELQQEQLRQNINKLKGEKKADTVIGRGFPLFHMGIADWAVFSTQITGLKSSTRLNLALGAIVAGGEANVFLNVNNTQKFRKEDQFYNWRYVNNDFAPLRQITAGTIFTQATSTLYAPLQGVQITNTPTTYRRSFGTYTISNTTEPGWTVELYINNVLVNYVKADASGFYTFEVPLVYGASQVRLRFYGPWGEVRVSEQNINIPFNFLPQNQFEYTLTSGVVQDEEKNRFSRGSFNYGLSRRITIGGGAEMTTNSNNGEPMPFINTSVRLGSNFLFTGEHVKDVISRGLMSYQFPSKIKFEVNYNKYEKGQSAIKSGKGVSNNYIAEKKFIATVPIRTKKLAAFSRLTLNQLTLPDVNYNSGELLISTIVSGVSTNLTTAVAFTDPANKIITTNLSLTMKLAKGVRFTPLLQYDFSQNSFSRVRGEFEKSISNKGFVNMTYERDVRKNANFYGIGLRYNFSFVQISVFGRTSKSSSSSTQAINGSLLYNDKSHSLSFSNQNNVGRGGLIILPFLDINCNGKRDKGEPKVEELSLRVNAGRTTRNDKDTTIRVTGLEAYNHYFVDLDKNSFDNIAWQIKNPSIRVVAEPNHFKLIEVPVSVFGEASGNITLTNEEGQKGIGRIIVNIYNSKKVFVAKVLSESDGYISYLGLVPGKYYASVDEGQLKKLDLKSTIEKIPFTILPNKEGDVFSNLHFHLEQNQ